VIERVKAGQDRGFVRAHSLAETYAVLTRLPGGNQVPGVVAWQLIAESDRDLKAALSLTPKHNEANIWVLAAGDYERRTFCDVSARWRDAVRL